MTNISPVKRRSRPTPRYGLRSAQAPMPAGLTRKFTLMRGSRIRGSSPRVAGEGWINFIETRSKGRIGGSRKRVTDHGAMPKWCVFIRMASGAIMLM
jgi:hypothetical protein